MSLECCKSPTADFDSAEYLIGLSSPDAPKTKSQRTEETLNFRISTLARPLRFAATSKHVRAWMGWLHKRHR